MISDFLRELRIWFWGWRVNATTDRYHEADAARVIAWQRLMGEINSRSPRQVARMERQRGLR